MITNRISIVIVEFHSIDEIKSALTAVRRILPAAEVIVSSNSLYQKDMQDTLIKEFAECRWVFNERNGGFAYAMNRGLEIATGDFLIISNPDCLMTRGIHDMAAFLTRHPKVGAVAPKIVDHNGNLQDSARPYVTLQSYIWRQIKRVLFKREAVLESSFDYTSIQTVDWVIGAFIMVSRDAYLRTGGLCEDYFMYAEDLDWCTRIRRAGLEVVYYPEAEIVYKGSRSARKSKKYMRVFLRSHFTYWRRFGFMWGHPKRKSIQFDGLE